MVYRFGLFNNSCQACEYKLSFAAREEAIGSPTLAKKKNRLDAIRHLSIGINPTAESILGFRKNDPEISSPNLSFSRTRSPLPGSNKYSISFSARSVASCRSVHCLWAHLTHAALVPARVLGSAAWGCPETRMILARHFTTINEYTTRHPNRKGTRKKSLPRSRISNKAPPLATA